ncbi:MAG: N-acetylmuramoyl-L-alanine amidase [Oscillospiraceae bacterium]|nr:N-acetylmuramoyl-L-alanine amidase [Oscillospiraceae bacterium]
MNRTRRILCGGIAAAAGFLTAALLSLSAAAAEAYEAGWRTEDGKRYYTLADGSPAAGVVEVDDLPYVFAPNGAQQTGWQNIGDKRYYYDPKTGAPVFGQLHWRGEDYYVTRESGKQTGLTETEAGSVFADDYGVILHETWIPDGDVLRYAGADRYLVSGETVIGGQPFLFDADCTLLTGWQTASDGVTRYYAAEAAAPEIRTGWLELPEGTYYADPDAGRLCGMHELDGKYYDFAETGEMLTGLYAVGGVRYWFTAEGRAENCWQESEGQRYYFGADGAAVRGLCEIDGDTYYFDENGVMQTGSITLDQPRFFNTETGKCISGWQQTDAGTVYLDGLTGTRLTGWQTIGESQYYFSQEGIMQTGSAEIDGKQCRFGADGVYRPVTICLDAGHYGKYNRSPVNNAYWESDFTWKMHLYLKEELEQYGIQVITTRTDKDTDLALENRGLTAKGCDLFLSIHSNACDSAAEDAPLACCAINGSADELGLMLANCVADVMQTKQRGHIWKREGLRGDWYGVLRGATKAGTPAILLEHSFHTNPRATAWLLVDANVRRMAKAEAELLARYFGQIP